MFESRKSVLSTRLAERIVSYHNDLVFNKGYGGKADRMIATLFKIFHCEMVEAIAYYQFNVNELKQAFVRDGVFNGTRDAPKLDELANTVFNLEEQLLLADIFEDSTTMINKVHAIQN